MTEIKRVKIQNLVENQIPEFLNTDNPLFREFLEQYYISQEHQTGIADLAVNINTYKSIDNFNSETFYRTTSTCNGNILSFDDVINVTNTIGFPTKYGLIKIDDEIITYTGKTETSFTGCIRGFSGIENIGEDTLYNTLTFASTEALPHSSGKVVENLNLIFFKKLFEKFKAQFLPGFENREFYSDIKIENILTRAKDFYISKGTDTSFKILFRILYGSEVEIIKPQEYMLRPSDNNYFITSNILVEKINGDIDPLELKGKSIFQQTPDGLASGSIYNVEYRPYENKKLYEISLDKTSTTLNFISTKKTNISESVAITTQNGSIIVDSTVGFAATSILAFTDNLPQPLVLTYTDKTVNQFLNVTGITNKLSINDEIVENNFAYTFDDSNNKIDFRIINLIDNVDYSKTSNLRVGDTIKLSTFGHDLSDSVEFNSWIYNLPTQHNIKSILKLPGNKGWLLETLDKVSFYKGDKLTLTNPDLINDTPIVCNVTDFTESSITVVPVPSNSNIENKTVITKNINKINASKFSNITGIIPSGIQNTYTDTSNNTLYVTSSGLPNYEITADSREIKIVGSANSILETESKHNLYTGEQVYYSAGSGSGISTGVYFIKNQGNTSISLCYSKSNLFAGKYIQTNVNTENGSLVRLDFENKSLVHQKLLRKFNLGNKGIEIDSLEKRSTTNKPIGMLINGVELYSPTLYNQNIYYGKLDSVEVYNKGSGYDVINAPQIEINDYIDSIEYGSGAKAHLNLTGSIKEVKIIRPGVGYSRKPKITISGGNGVGARLETNLVKSRIVSGFRADNSGIGVDLTTNTITFIGNHNFDDGEIVEYSNNSNNDLTPLTNNSQYYVGVINQTQLKLYSRKVDADNKNNPIDLTAFATGLQYFKSLNSKNTITKVYVVDEGVGYSNRYVTVNSVLSTNEDTMGINTYDNYIFTKNHTFKNKDLVVYTSTGSVISGLTSNSNYYVSVIDENKFKLSYAGLNTSLTTINYDNSKYINFNSIGSGTHKFSYPPISINVETISDIESVDIIPPVLEPIVLGSIDSIYLEEAGSGYGTPDIINFHRRPNVDIKKPTSNALLVPIILNKIIVGVQILNSGSGYQNDIDIIITGDGKYAELYPTINENGEIEDIIILNGGIGYTEEKTSIQIEKRGIDASFNANVYEWKINQVVKNNPYLGVFNNNTKDDGILIPSKNKALGLQYINLYLPKKLRDLTSPTTSATNSRIIGWAYDGHPIYGPYYNNTLVKSGYDASPELGSEYRPPTIRGFFTQDFMYAPDPKNDARVLRLDEYNGAFIKNTDFPEGTYAYFTPINTNGTPIYPYVIGSKFKDLPTIENYTYTYSQDLDFNTLNIIRNTGPYYLNYNNSNYEIINKIEDAYKQEFSVESLIPSMVDKIDVYYEGSGYKVGDSIKFKNSNTGGFGASAVVSKLKGATLDTITVGIETTNPTKFTRYGNTIVGIVSTYHNLQTGDEVKVSAISTTTYNYLEGYKTISVNQKTVGIVTEIKDISITGVSTFIITNDISGFEVEDFIRIDNEILKITNISSKQSKLYVNRLENTGIHSVGISSVSLLPRKFSFYEEFQADPLIVNQTQYFDPYQTVGVGTTNTIKTLFDNTIITIPAKSIYIPNHGYYNGQQLIYNSGILGTGLTIYNNVGGALTSLQDNQVVYAVNRGKDFIGISTVGYTTSSGIGSNYNSSYFYPFSSGIGLAHNLTTTYPEVSGKVENYFIDLVTTSTHGLTSGDIVETNIELGAQESIKFRYDSAVKKITTGLITFDPNLTSEISSEIYIPGNDLNTGDKIVYYNNEYTIPGLQNNKDYFVIKTHPDKIKLAEYYSDAISGNYIKLSPPTLPDGNHSITLINPPIEVTQGNVVTFDLSDDSLENMELRLYKDLNCNIELESYKYITVDKSRELNTNDFEYTNELYYNFISNIKNKIPSSDIEVKGRNKIKILPNNLNGLHSIVSTGQTSFKISLKTKPVSDSYNINSTNNIINYTTNSKTASGGISYVKINFGGKSYSQLPGIESIDSATGVGAVLKANSSSIGKIDTLSRVKDGFDYPTDKTLCPYLSVPAIVTIKGISRVNTINVVDGGYNYHTTPTLKVIGKDNLKLSANIQGGSIISVDVIENVNDLLEPLSVIPIHNSNGYDISDISVSNGQITLELLNVDNQVYPLITTGYGKTDVVFPFSVGDKIFIENCRIDSTGGSDNYNSAKYDYKYFTLTNVSERDYTITYSANEVSETFSAGNYTSDYGYGYVINFKDLAKFEMKLIDDLSYISGETVTSKTFSAKVFDNGWDNNINQLRLIDVKGELTVRDILKGEQSKLNGIVESVNIFNLNSTLGVSRDKLNDFGDRVGLLNDYYQRISDNDYYQKFSYSIKGEIPYSKWKEPIRSLVHPSGFKEFSDLNIISTAPTNMKVSTASTVSLLVNIDNLKSLYTRNNFTLVTEIDQFEDGSIERIITSVDGANVAGIGPSDIKGRVLKSYILNKTNKVIDIDDISSQFTGVTSTTGGEIIGLTTFKLKAKGSPLFYLPFDSGSSDVVNIDGDEFKIVNHNLQSGQKILYSSENNSPVGIATTSEVESSAIIVVGSGSSVYLAVASTASNILMNVAGTSGSSLYENGYNVGITTKITGVSSSIVGASSRLWGYVEPYIPVKSTTGIGIDAKFSVFITHNPTTGSPISTSIILREGGTGYGVGNVVSISGTYMGGATPANDLSFTVSRITNSIVILGINSTYSNIPGNTIVGVGTDAIFDVVRNQYGSVSNVIVKNGGVGYALSSQISIAGTYIGGITPQDNVIISPKVLGTNILPSVVYVNKNSDNSFKVSGLSVTAPLSITNLGFGTNSFSVDNPNSNAIISIDNLIQSPIYKRNLTTKLAANVAIGSSAIYLTNGISSITSLDILQVDNEYFKIRNIGIGSTNVIDVSRGFLGTSESTHTINSNVNILRGNYNIIKDTIYFAAPPYGPAGLPDLTTSSKFNGRVFSRRFDAYIPNDKNLILDDISDQFTGIDTSIATITGTLNSTNRIQITGINTSGINISDIIVPQFENGSYLTPNTKIIGIGSNKITINQNHLISVGIATTTFSIIRRQFILKSNTENVVGIYTNTNGGNVDINNNPIILINNIPQISETDFTIDTVGQNTLKFLSGAPIAGKILRLGITTGFGYAPLVGASATVTVSPAGTISNVYIRGYGSGYRTVPGISIASTIGGGALISATVGAGGTISTLSIVNAGSGYTSTSLPIVVIDNPLGYSNLPVSYASGYTGTGQGAKISVVVGVGSSIIGFNLDNPGKSYKVGDVLTCSGITTNPNAGASFNEFRMTIQEIYTDIFSGWYPGQFIQFDDISSYFNGIKKKFTLSIKLPGQVKSEVISLKTKPGSDLIIENNFFIYINDVLQEPKVAYDFSNSRITFTEAPKAGSKCNVLFFRGSDLDVEVIEPPKTIKEGDIVQIDQNDTILPQFERVVKKIVSSDTLDTFTYNSIGINTDPTQGRPLNWTKQTKDTIISGVLYSKSRPDLKSRIIPTTKIIKSVSKLDTVIYVNNAFPIFSELDKLRGVDESLRSIVITDTHDNESAVAFATATTSGEIGKITITSQGSGYINSNPTISISKSYIANKDPIYSWIDYTGITTTSRYNAVGYGNSIVAIGNSGSYAYSLLDGASWISSNIPTASNIDFFDIISDANSNYVAVGSSGNIYRTNNISNNSSWSKNSLYELIGTPFPIKSIFTQTPTFNSITYNNNKDICVAVGSSGNIFTAVGITTTEFIKNGGTNTRYYNAITNNNLNTYVIVGNSGVIVCSKNAKSWPRVGTGVTSANLYDVIWDGTKFVAVGANSTILTSIDGISWSLQYTSNLQSFRKVNYTNGIYTFLRLDGGIMISFDLKQVYSKFDTGFRPKQIYDLNYIPSINKYIGVGSLGSITYTSEPTLHNATATPTVSNGKITNITISDGGFGYPSNTEIPVLIAPDSNKNEILNSVKVGGDFGTIIGIQTNLIGFGTISPAIKFTLKSEVGTGYSSLSNFGITYSNLTVGDYFIIYDSNVRCGHALTGITTSMGGMSNYPNSIVGTAVSFIDGVYRVEDVSAPVSGIVTVRCNFAPYVGGNIQVDAGAGVEKYYGSYSWGKFYDYQNRIFNKPYDFIINTNNGIVGLNTAPDVYRTRGII